MPMSNIDREKNEEAYRALGCRIWEDGTLYLNFHTDLTLRCNASCKDCCKLLGLLPINKKETDLTKRHVKKASRMFSKSKIKIRRLRMSGGEPLMHPNFEGMFRYINEVWSPLVTRVYTNDIIDMPWGRRRIGSIMRPMPMDRKKIRHIPFYISPYDLGMPPIHGFSDCCKMASSCGRSFNVYGFTPCMLYPHIGRILGKDVHSSHPMILGSEEICRHCICSLTRGQQLNIREKVRKGEIDYPTKTFRKGIEREKEHPTSLRNFLDR